MTSIELLDESFYKTNPLFTSINVIAEFTKPLKILNMGYFTFDRHYHDNSRISLTNAGDWIKHYWKNKLYENSIFEKDHLNFSNGHVLWSWLNREPVYSTASLYEIDNGITITEKHEHYCDFFNFGSINGHAISNDHIIKNLPFLYHFISLFKHKMSNLVCEAEKNKIYTSVAVNKNQASNKAGLNHEIAETDLLKILDEKDISRVYLGGEFENSYLTKKEFELMGFLASGLTSYETGIKLKISNDTVNKHIKNIKNKLNCKTLCELGFAMGKIVSGNIYPFKKLGL